MNWEQLLCSERRRSTTVAQDHRAEFERDYDRAVFSTPVKRLQDKTQVFPLDPNDAVRTRLTHSMEVSSVARGLAIAISKWLEKEGELPQGRERDVEAIAATCGLIHDLGNPPFGHAGELAIQEWFSRGPQAELLKQLGPGQLASDFRRFEGNAQTLRLVATLQVLADFYGLNLTYGTLSASCKYLAPSHGVDDKRGQGWKKPGYFASEQRVIEEIREKTGTGDARNPITLLVEAADDIVYSAADIEDAVKKGLMSWQFVEDLLIKGSASGQGKDKVAQVRDIQSAILSNSPAPALLSNETKAAAFRTAVIRVMVGDAASAFKRHYESIKAGTFGQELIRASDSGELVALLKRIGRQHVYCAPATLKLELMGRRIIGDLLDLFWEGAAVMPLDESESPKGLAAHSIALLSANYKLVCKNDARASGLPDVYHRFHLVTDYVCGMTDSFAARLHAELTNG